jgi:hypothetical protein
MKQPLLLSLSCLCLAIALSGCNTTSRAPSSASPATEPASVDFGDIPPPPTPPPLTPENIAWPEDMPQEVRDQLWKELEENQMASPAAEVLPPADLAGTASSSPEGAENDITPATDE